MLRDRDVTVELSEIDVDFVKLEIILMCGFS